MERKEEVRTAIENKGAMTEELSAALDALEPGIEHLVLDLKALEYTSSAGLRQLVAAHKKMNGALTIKNVSVEVMDVLHMAGLDKRLHIEQ